MGQVRIDPDQLSRAANGLDAIVKHDYERNAAVLRQSYPLEPPGLGTMLGTLEAYYNEVADYHARNLRAAADAVGEIAAGLRATVRLSHAGEEAHSEMMLATARVPSDPGRAVLRNAAADRSAPGRLPDWAHDAVPVDLRVQADFLRIAFATAGMAPSYLPAPVAISGLVTNLVSVQATANALTDIAANLQTDVNARFDLYTVEATVGWEEGGVEAYQSVVAIMNAELDRVRTTIDALAATLMSVYSLLASFWAAFTAFTGDFFRSVLRLHQERSGADATTTLARVGADACSRWLTAHRSVLTTVSTAVTQLGETIADFSAGRPPGDIEPRFERITLSWQPP